jgi:hypothetical protein
MYLLFAISAAVLILLWFAVRGRNTQVPRLESAEQALVPVDIEAFRNLIDSQQDRFLRQHLPARDFRRVQRARYRAVTEYLWQVADNASVILRLGESARASHEAGVESQGSELATAAIAVRLYCLLALVQAYSGVLFPGVNVSVGAVADSYDRLTAKVWAISRSWTPARRAVS